MNAAYGISICGFYEMEKYMLYTSYFAQLRNIPNNVIPVSICLKPPAFFKGLQYKKVAPKSDFFNEWKKNNDNNFYIQKYNEEVLDKLSVTNILNELHNMLPKEIREQLQCNICDSDKWHIALMCYEKPDSFCHRHLLSEWFNNQGIHCTEWKKGE